VVALAFGGGALVASDSPRLAGNSASDKQHDAFALCPDPADAVHDAAAANALIASGRHRASPRTSVSVSPAAPRSPPWCSG